MTKTKPFSQDINSMVVERVSSFKFLVVHISEDLGPKTPPTYSIGIILLYILYSLFCIYAYTVSVYNCFLHFRLDAKLHFNA